MYFNFVAKDASIEKKDEFLSTIREVLSDIVKNGFNEKAIRARVFGNKRTSGRCTADCR
jgi:Zn-dependent M16 (insulinase) family peptidase